MQGPHRKIDFRRTNGDQIILKTNEGLVIPLERIHGMELWNRGENPGVNNEKGRFYGWIEVNPSPKLDKNLLDDAPLKILIKPREGWVIKYAECELVNKPLAPEEKTQNDAFGLEGTVSLSLGEQGDFEGMGR